MKDNLLISKILLAVMLMIAILLIVVSCKKKEETPTPTPGPSPDQIKDIVTLQTIVGGGKVVYEKCR